MTEQQWPDEVRAAVVSAMVEKDTVSGRNLTAGYWSQYADAVLAALAPHVVPQDRQAVSIVVPEVGCLAPHETTAGRLWRDIVAQWRAQADVDTALAREAPSFEAIWTYRRAAATARDYAAALEQHMRGEA